MIKKRVTFLTGLVALFVVATLFFIQREVRQMKMISEHEAWQKTRLAELMDKESGWLNLAGLFWVEEGVWSMGGAAGNDYVLSEGNAPEHLGKFIRRGEEITFVPLPYAINTDKSGKLYVDGAEASAEPILLIDDGGESRPTVLSNGSLQWWIIARDGMLGVRVRDMKSLRLEKFAGIDSYNFDAGWKIGAQFLPFESPTKFEYPTILGTMRTEESPGVLVFELDGRQYEMIPFIDTDLFLVFGDQTNGETTYEGGRFLHVNMPDERGRTTIDFNRAYNPPCAFSPYSTCPRPLKQNRLATEVDAGEKVYAKTEAGVSSAL